MPSELNLEVGLRALLIGVGATIVMDAWLLALKRLGVPAMNLAMLGRWVGRLGGRSTPGSGPANAPPTTGEAILGLTVHYAVGVGFAGVLILLEGSQWTRSPRLLPALITGIATVLAPLCILQPAMGAGFAGARTATPLLNCTRTLANHLVYGVGLYLAALTIAGVQARLIASHL